MTRRKFNVTVYNRLEDAAPDWKALESNGCLYAFQSYHWISHWFETIGTAQRVSPLIVVVTDEEKSPLMLLPLQSGRSGPFRLITPLGGIVTDYFSAIFARSVLDSSADDFKALWRAVKNALPRHDAIRIVKLPQWIHEDENPFLGLPHIPYADSYSAMLAPDWETYYNAQVKKRIRADSRRQRKRLAEIGETRFVIAETDEKISEITSAMIRHKQRRYAETGMPDLFSQPGSADFYRQFPGDAPSCRLHVSALYVGDEIVATHWGVHDDERFYFLMPTYEGGDWKRYSAGRILLEELMQWCFEKNLRVFDFSLGGEEYKTQWCNLHMPLYEAVEASSAMGGLYLALQQFKRRAMRSEKLKVLLLSLKQKLGDRG